MVSTFRDIWSPNFLIFFHSLATELAGYNFFRSLHPVFVREPDIEWLQKKINWSTFQMLHLPCLTKSALSIKRLCKCKRFFCEVTFFLIR